MHKSIKLLALVAVALCIATPLAAQTTVANQIPDCPTLGQALNTIPEISSNGTGILTGTLYTVSEQQAFPVRPSGRPGTVPNVCAPQWVRAYRSVAPNPNPSSTTLTYPMPGPVLRARVGDLVLLKFFNQIDYNKFPKADEQCDQTSTYPPPNVNETFPDCFSESVFTNVHYHGTHTSPSSLADNVFLLIRPAPRAKDGTNAPVVTEANTAAAMNDVFTQCKAQLNDPTSPQQWPTYWSDLPQSFRDQQNAWLAQYNPDWLKKNQNQINAGLWPQYYIGAYPYCFRLPRYPGSTWPPTAKPATQGAHTHGAGLDQVVEAQDPNRPLMMGQAPGLHWYHAHKHGSTTINVMNGMTGVFVIEGQYDDDINSFYGKGFAQSAKILVIQQLGSVPRLEVAGATGTPASTGSNADFSVNGQIQPTITMKSGEVQMWRIANTSARAGAYFQAPPNGFQWRQLAQDGVQFINANYQASLNQSFLLMSGNRADILVKAPAYNASGNNKYTFTVYNSVDPRDRPPRATGTPLTLVTVQVVQGTPTATAFMPNAPSFPPYLADIADSEIQGTTTLLFASSGNQSATNPSQHTINGLKFNGQVGASVTLNQVEEWKIVSATFGPTVSHPFHIHINPFQVTEIFDPNALLPGTTTPRYVIEGAGTPVTGQCVLSATDQSTWKPCYQTTATSNRVWWDVFPIPSGATLTGPNNTTVQVPGYFKMRSRFVDYAGEFVLHCHILAHEDRGMMTGVMVTPLQSPYSHQ